MANRSWNSVLRFIRRTISVPPGADATDPYLLDRYTVHQDEDAFEALLRRHGPIVLGVCRRVLRDEHLAEDAFQATFLVLARKAGSIGQPAALGAWLYRVAYHIALRARRHAHRRRTLERRVNDVPEQEPVAPGISEEARLVLDEELNRLPEKYRAPIILCYWEGKTYEQAAVQLGCPGGTVSGRLARARELLRKRLSHRGMALPAGALAAALSPEAVSAAVPATMVTSTVKAAIQFAAGKAAAAGVISAQAGALAAATLRTMFVAKLLWLVTVLLVLGLAGTVAGVVVSIAKSHQPQNLAENDNVLIHEMGVPIDRGGGLPRAPRFPALLHRFAVPAPGRLAFSPDGKTLTWAQAQDLRAWDVASGKELHRWQKKGRGVVALASDASIVAMRETRGNVYILDAATGQEICQLAGEDDSKGRSGMLTFSPDRRLLTGQYSSGSDCRIRFWDTASGKELQDLPGLKPGAIRSLALSSDNQILALGHEGTDIKLYQLARIPLRSFGEPRQPLPEDLPDTRSRSQGRAASPSRIVAILSVAFSPDGQTLAAGNNDGGIDLWEVATGKKRQHLGSGPRPLKDLSVPGIGFLTYSRDGKTLLSLDTFLGGQGERKVRLWDASLGKERPPLPIQGSVYYSALSGDGWKVAAALVADLNTSLVEVWDL